VKDIHKFLLPRTTVVFSSPRGAVYVRNIAGKAVCLEGARKGLFEALRGKLEAGLEDSDVARLIGESRVSDALDLLYTLSNEGIIQAIDSNYIDKEEFSQIPIFADIARRVPLTRLSGILKKLTDSEIRIVPASKLALTFLGSIEEYGVQASLIDLSNTKGLSWQPPYNGRKILSQVTSPALELTEWNEENLAEAFKGADLVVSLTDNQGFPVHELANLVSIRNQIAWLGGWVDSGIGHVGPLTIPSLSACYECTQARLLSNAEDMEEEISFIEHLRKNPGLTIYPNGLLNLMTGLLVNEAVNHLGGVGTPELVNRHAIISMDYPLQVSIEDVVRVPDCPVCGKIG
jgi:bacteriocin biosynthesis cyclodehydratase domain-containing protein